MEFSHSSTHEIKLNHAHLAFCLLIKFLKTQVHCVQRSEPAQLAELLKDMFTAIVMEVATLSDVDAKKQEGNATADAIKVERVKTSNFSANLMFVKFYSLFIVN
jgi:hypothetical protein